MLSDLRESGSIEQDADIVLFIYREDMYMRREEWEALHPDTASEPYPHGMAQLIVAKHRNGPTGIVEVRFAHRVLEVRRLRPAGGEPVALWSKTTSRQVQGLPVQRARDGGAERLFLGAAAADRRRRRAARDAVRRSTRWGAAKATRASSRELELRGGRAAAGVAGRGG